MLCPHSLCLFSYILNIIYMTKKTQGEFTVNTDEATAEALIHTEPIVAPGTMPVLIPFDASRDNVQRLLLLLRSFVAFAKFGWHPVIIGDRPAEVSDEVPAIPFASEHRGILGVAVTAVQSTEMTKEFIIAPLKTILNRPILLAHCILPKRSSGGVDMRFPTVYDKSLLRQAYDTTSQNGNMESTLFDTYFLECNVPPMLLDWRHDGILLPVVSERPSPDNVMRFLRVKAAIYVQHESAFEFLQGVLSRPLDDDRCRKFESEA